MKKPKYMPRKSSGYTEPMPYVIFKNGTFSVPKGSLLARALESSRQNAEFLIRYATGNQDINTYRKALGLPPETVKMQKTREKRAKELEEMFTKQFLFVDPPLVEWSCRGFLGYRK